MGNIISGSDNNLISNSELKNVIHNWAINDYDAGLSYGKNYTIKNLLKKRSCCTRNNNMVIALPNIDINNAAAPVKDGYYPVNIQIYDNPSDVKTANCNFINEATPNITTQQSFYQKIIQQNSNVAANPNCTALYTAGGSNTNLCGSVKSDRTYNYAGNLPRIAYGFYATDPNNLNSYNNYTDCNCQNSMLRDISHVEIISGAPNIGVKDTLVQSNDTYCTDCLTSGKCYIPSYQRSTSLCINLSSIKDAVAENNSNIKNNQECNTTNINQTSFSDFLSKNIVIISVVLILIVGLIIGAIVIF